ncbi:hypothetical protein RFM99_19825 [Mesorhizobium sp. VK4C]|uniref:hypothetical protein n=1 Tax=Mesorhizobium captivum TaxID=3072319 RepID=UPI002A245533|nr:hypothetical protein [Mesorhizobium sp. VK4C]MDX8500657.1 hypothetical protein [Mesorhizobium sp. VK4C]
MYRVGLQVLAAVFVMALGASFALAGDMANYKDIPTFRQAQPRECDADDTESVQVSCRYIEVGSIDGYQLDGHRKEKDPRWAKLKKYQLGGRIRLKLAGTACARGRTEAEATSIALSRAANGMKEVLQDWEDETFTDQLTGLGFNKYDDGYNCKRTPNTSGQDQPSASNGSTQAAPQSEALNNAARQQAQQRRIAEQQARAEAEARKTRATFVITNSDRYTLGLAFYSKNYGGEWPGNGKQYVLSGTKTYNLKCTPGEKICFGAWRDHQTKYWGVGRKGNEGCEHCCIQCGQTYQTNLTDGGPDAYPQTSSGGEVLNDVIGAIGLGAAIYQGLNGGGGGTYSAPAPAPRAKPYRPSGISGGN